MIMLIVESMVFFWFSSSSPSFIFIEAFCLSDTSKAQTGTCPLHFHPVCHHPFPVVKGQCKNSLAFSSDNFRDYIIIIIWHLTYLLKLSFVSSTGNLNCIKSLGRLCELHAWIAREINPITTTSSCSAEKSSMESTKLLQSESKKRV